MQSTRTPVFILCVTLGLCITNPQSDAQIAERAHGEGFCDVIQRNESPCVLVKAARETRESQLNKTYISLKKGLIVPLRIIHTVHSLDVQPHTVGQRVEFEVAEDVDRGLVVIAAATEAWDFLGESSQAPGRFFTHGYLQIIVEGTRNVTGEIVPLSGALEVAGGTPCGDDGTGGCAMALLVLGPFMKGSDAEIKKGTYISAQIADGVFLDRTALERTPVVRRIRHELEHTIKTGRGLLVLYRLPDDGCRLYESTNGGPFRPESCGKAHFAIEVGSETNLTAGHVLQFELDPGEHILHGPNIELPVTVNSGSVQYIRIHVSRWKRHAKLAIVPPEIAEAESYPLEREELPTS